MPVELQKEYEKDLKIDLYRWTEKALVFPQNHI
jgi:hypothetical protein